MFNIVTLSEDTEADQTPLLTEEENDNRIESDMVEVNDKKVLEEPNDEIKEKEEKNPKHEPPFEYVMSERKTFEEHDEKLNKAPTVTLTVKSDSLKSTVTVVETNNEQGDFQSEIQPLELHRFMFFHYLMN